MNNNITATKVLESAIKAYNPFEGCSETLEILDANYHILSERMQFLTESMDAYMSGSMMIAPLDILQAEYEELITKDTLEDKLDALFTLDILTTASNY